jgi:hypothetical protein
MRLHRSGLAIGLVLAAGLHGPAELAAQSPGASPGRILLESRPASAGVAVSVRLPGGAVHDPAGSEGTAVVLGRVLEIEAERRLAPFSARAHVDVALRETTITLFAPSESWLPAWQEVAALLTGASLPEATVAAARARLVDELIFQSGAPVRAFGRAWQGLRLAGTVPEGTDAARPLQGSVQGLSAVSASTLEAFRSRHFTWPEATLAVVGNAGLAEVATLGGGRLELVETLPADTARPPAPAPADTAVVPDEGVVEPALTPPVADTLPPAARRIAFPASPLVVPAPAADGRAWATGERRMVDEEITSTWIGVAWALPRGTPWVLRDFLAHVVGEALSPSPPDPGLFRADVHLEDAGGAPLLVVTAAVDPQAAVAWEARILETLAGVAAEPPPGAFFELARRRYRSARLLEFADPALRARWLTARAAEPGALPRVSTESWGLTREALAELAAGAGEPRILVYGSARMMALPGS